MEITLNPNGWHRRLQKFVFKNPPTFHNFCPYFWLTNFCILVTFIIPIVPLIYLIGGMCIGLSRGIEWLGDFIDEKICKPAFAHSAMNMSDEALIRSWAIHDHYHGGRYNWSDNEWADYDFWCRNYFDKSPHDYSYKKKEIMDKKFEVWKSKNPDWQEKLNAIKAERRKAWEKQKAEQEASLKRMQEEAVKNADRIERAKVRKQKAMIAIIKYTKWLAIVFGVAVLALVCYWVYLLGVYIYDHFYWDRFVTVMKYVGIVAGIACAVGLLIYLIVLLVRSTACSSIGLCRLFETAPMRWVGRQLVSFGRWIGRGLNYVFTKIGGFFEFFGTYIMAVKKDYCPGIKWQENTK